MILHVDKITMQFGGIKAINELSFSIKDKEIYGLIGPNGAGKTTAFNVITGNYIPSSGSIKFENKDVVGVKPHKIVKLGIARTFQNIRLFKSMSVMDNILIGFDSAMHYTYLESILRLPRFFSEEKKSRQKAKEIMEYFGLLEFEHHKASELSYGNQRKVEIARAIATNPKLLLLDEPAAGMNPAETKELATLIKKAKDDFDISILLIEHDMKFVNHLCDRVLVLDYGKMIFEGKPSEAIKNEEVVSAYLGDFIHD
jgi:branched-chain amino acid transport system ATP-binding protein